MAAGNPAFDQILSTTLKNYRATLEDNIFKDTPLLDFLARKGQIDMKDGGEKIVVQLMYGKNSTVKRYSGAEQLNIGASDGISAAEFPWKQIAATVTINGLQEAQNSGKAQLVSLVKSKVFQAEESLSETLNSDLFSDGTADSGKQMGGLDLLINDHNGTAVVGGIDCTDGLNTWWRSVVVDATTDGDAVRSDDEWTNAYYTASKGKRRPDFAITTQALFEHYESSLAPQLRFTSNDEADARFQNLAFKGIRIYFDLACPAKKTYFLNSKYISLVGHKQNWFRNTGFKEAIDYDAKWAQILSYGNLTVSNRSRHAVVTKQEIA